MSSKGKRKLVEGSFLHSPGHSESKCVIDLTSEDVFESVSVPKPSKRVRTLPKASEVIDIDDDDDITDIIAQINAQEETERLTKRVQAEGSSSGGTSIEDDEAMAKKLAQEWGYEAESSPEYSGVANIASISPKPFTRGPSKSLDRSPDDLLEEFKSTFTTERSCSTCGKPVAPPRGQVVFNTKGNNINTIPPTLGVLMHAPCTSCRTNHCRGCFSPVKCRQSCKGSTVKTRCPVESCCAEGRAIALFEALGGFDRKYISERTTAESRARGTIAVNQGLYHKSVGPGGTGYGTDQRHGRGSQAGPSNGKKRGPTQHKINKQQAQWDALVISALTVFTELLPRPCIEEPQIYDMLPHPSIGHLLSVSKLSEVLGDLLRNDSVTDWIARKEVYQAILAFLRRLADCELTVGFLLDERWVMKTGSEIGLWMWGEEPVSWEKDKHGNIELAPPLFDYFKKLSKQCESFMAGVSQLMDTNEDEEEAIQGLSLCGDIIAAKGDMERAMAIISNGASSASDSDGKGKGKNIDPAILLEQEYSKACERLCFKHVSWVHSLPRSANLHIQNGPPAAHNFLYQFQTQSGTRLPKDRFHLVKELAVMNTSLPPGIWVRVDEVRNDAIRVMIAGPEGTPYAGGLFEFDCFMPIDYPRVPPILNLRTTGRGSVRFNPNLYNTGYVCLSLLGTWSGRGGENWNPGKSTLLQVLVSIQSMILVEAPYFNEPGYGQADLNSHASIAYNREITLQTVRWAMVDWLQDEHRLGLWGEVIATHFMIRQKQIRQSIAQWSKIEPRIEAENLLEHFDKRMRNVQAWHFNYADDE